MRYGVLVFLCAAAVIAYVQRTALSVPTKQIQNDLYLTAEDLGLVMGCWYWAYGLLQIPSGWLADRVGSKRAMLLFAVLWSCAVGLVGLAKGMTGLLLLWAMTGLAQAGLVPTAVKSIRGWFPETDRATAAGFFIASMALGSAIASFVAATLLKSFTWREMLGLYVLPGLIWAIAFGFVVPSAKERLPAAVPMGNAINRMATSLPMILLCAQMFLRAGAMAFFFTWFPRFLQETRGVSQSESGELAVWPGIGAMIGGLLGGLTSDWLLRATGHARLSRQGLAVLGMVFCSTFAVTAHFIQDPGITVLLISVGAFWATLGGVSGYTVAIELGGRRVATVFSVMNAAGSVGAGLFTYTVGWIVKRVDHWDFVLLMFAGVFAADAVCWAFLNPKGPLFTDETEFLETATAEESSR